MALLEGSKVARSAFVQLTKDEQEKLINMINSGLENVAEKLSPDEFLTLARAFIGVAHEVAQHAKAPFEGRGDIRQIHFNHAAEALSTTNICMQRLHELMNTTPHLPDAIARFRDQLIVEVELVVSSIEPEGSDNLRLDTYPSKEDIKKRLTGLLQKLDKLDRHIQGQDLTW